MAAREVVIGCDVYEQRVDDIVAPAIFLPEAAYYIGAADFPTTGYAYSLLQRGSSLYGAVAEPVTQADALRLLLRIHAAVWRSTARTVRSPTLAER